MRVFQKFYIDRYVLFLLLFRWSYKRKGVRWVLINSFLSFLKYLLGCRVEIDQSDGHVRLFLILFIFSCRCVCGCGLVRG
jgi:hypothetical protein